MRGRAGGDWVVSMVGLGSIDVWVVGRVLGDVNWCDKLLCAIRDGCLRGCIRRINARILEKGQKIWGGRGWVGGGSEAGGRALVAISMGREEKGPDHLPFPLPRSRSRLIPTAVFLLPRDPYA